jgi:anaerobic magnesium-protoporphyrin IX monomethyl ester cyclase
MHVTELTNLTRVLFVEPPKDIWFVMGEYLPPPYGMLQLAAYLESQINNVDIDVVDCQAMGLDWKKLEKRIESFNPDVVASSGFATCNAYVTARTCETVKKVIPEALTVTGGQHFTVTAQESLEAYPEIDVIVRGEGVQTLVELVRAVDKAPKKPYLSKISGLSFRHGQTIQHNPDRPLMKDLDALPFPGYHFVKDYAHKYHFMMMTGRMGYGMVEASRGCPHRCTFCSQWKHWQGAWRHKSVKRVADEMEYLYANYGARLLWLTDDNFGFGNRMEELCDQLTARRFSDDLTIFMQGRCDDVVKNKDLLPKMYKAGINYLLLGVESHSKFTLNSFRKGTSPEDNRKAVQLLKENSIFSQATCIIGERSDTAKTISDLREFINFLDPDLAIFMILTPYPGTDLFEEAKRNGWIEDWNWSNYDMIHAIMPTETLTREEVQQELYKCYRSFFGSWRRRVQGVFSNNKIKRRVYRYMTRQTVLRQLKSLS